MLATSTGENSVVYRHNNATVLISRTLEAASIYDHQWAEREANRLDVPIDMFWPSRMIAYYQITVINVHTGEALAFSKRLIKFPDYVKFHPVLGSVLTDLLSNDVNPLEIGTDLAYMLATVATVHVAAWDTVPSRS